MSINIFNNKIFNYQQSISWIKTNLGNYILHQEMQSISNFLKEIHGINNFLLIGELEFFFIFKKLNKLFDKDKNVEQFILNFNLHNLYIKNKFFSKLPNNLIIADPNRLPIDKNSIDVICLPHFVENVHEYLDVLAEVYRILRPRGKIILTGFTKPIFWQYFKKFINAKIDLMNGSDRFFTFSELKYLLISLGFDEIKIEYNCYNFLVNNKFVLNCFKFLEKISKFSPYIKGNIYVISACKKILPITPVSLKEWSDVIFEDDLAKNVLKS